MSASSRLLTCRKHLQLTANSRRLHGESQQASLLMTAFLDPCVARLLVTRACTFA